MNILAGELLTDVRSFRLVFQDVLYANEPLRDSRLPGSVHSLARNVTWENPVLRDHITLGCQSVASGTFLLILCVAF